MSRINSKSNFIFPGKTDYTAGRGKAGTILFAVQKKRVPLGAPYNSDKVTVQKRRILFV